MSREGFTYSRPNMFEILMNLNLKVDYKITLLSQCFSYENPVRSAFVKCVNLAGIIRVEHPIISHLVLLIFINEIR